MQGQRNHKQSRVDAGFRVGFEYRGTEHTHTHTHPDFHKEIRKPYCGNRGVISDCSA